MSVASPRMPRLSRGASRLADGWDRICAQAKFHGRTLRSIGDAVVYYKADIVRLVAQMSLGAGALAIIGETVVIVGFLTLSAGALIAVQGHNSRAAAAGYTGRVAETVAINPALAISGYELIRMWYFDPASLAVMRDCSHTEIGVWSENSLDRTVVVAVYGDPTSA